MLLILIISVMKWISLAIPSAPMKWPHTMSLSIVLVVLFASLNAFHPVAPPASVGATIATAPLFP